MDKKSSPQTSPRYDDIKHIDSTAIDHKQKQIKDYTVDYLKQTQE